MICVFPASNPFISVLMAPPDFFKTKAFGVLGNLMPLVLPEFCVIQ
jgi:hypothetical protein